MGRGTTLTLTWLEAEGNFSDGGLARFIESRFQKGCVLLYYFCIEFESTLAVYWNSVGYFTDTKAFVGFFLKIDPQANFRH